MDSLYNYTFSAKTIGYALAVSVALCLALPCVAVVLYALLMLLSFVVSYIGSFVFYVAFGPFYIIVIPINSICNYCNGEFGPCSIFVIPMILIPFIGVIIGFIQGLFAGFREIMSHNTTARRIVIFIVSFWLICLALMFVFYSIGFYHSDEDYGVIIRSYANSSCRSIINVFLEYKVYLYSWAPVAVAILPTFIIYASTLSFRLFRILCAGIRTLLHAVILGITVVYRLVVAGSCFILRALLLGITTLFRAIYTGIYTILYTLLLGIMIIVDWLFSKRKIRHICPNQDCGHIGYSSVYHCPHCGELLTNLKPSYDGIFYKKCPSCNNDVSSSCLTGRDKYAMACPKCLNTWEYFNFGNVPSSVFIVEGAAKSGKTSLLVQMLIHWSSLSSERVHFLIEEQKNAVRNLADSINEQRFCPSTTRLLHPEAYVMHCKKRFHSYLAYFYDTGGGASYSLQAGVAEPYFNLANGIFLVIDPWAERCVLDSFKGNNVTPPKAYQYSTQDANVVIGRLCSTLDRIYTKSFRGGFTVPICIIVTKCDIFGLSERIGVKNGHSQSSKQWAEQSRLVENYLVNIGMYNFVNAIKTRFKKYAFFAVSVLDDSSLSSDSVLNPLLWMTNNVQR